MPFSTRAESAVVPPPALNGSTYRMVAHAGQELPDEARYLLNFSDTRIGGKVCNQFGGAYELSGERLQAHKLVSTKMFCAQAGVMALEASLLKALSAGVIMQREAHRMVLLNADAQPLFSFQLFMD